jgi:putative ABC transport system permease protein
MSVLAIKNLFHDKVRLVVTLTGIVFALVLIVVQFGLFLGFLETSANVIDRSGVDLWITAPGLPHANGGTPMPEKRRYRALATPGVQLAEPYALVFCNWKLPSGATEAVQVVGFDVTSGMGGPWEIVQGSINDLRAEDTVMIDEHYAKKLGVVGLHQVFEINGRRAKVVGFTRGIRSFTTAPYIYTSFKNSQNYVPLAADQTIFLTIRLQPGADPHFVKSMLEKNVSGVDVYTNEELTAKTRNYWVFGTGAGITTLMGAVLGLLVGVVVVAQTIYSATVDHIREFGTLKAMGASNSYIYNVIIQQALLAAVMGFAIAITVSSGVVSGSRSGDALILLPPQMVAATLGLAVLMCVGASILSIRKATTIDPAMVFRG